MRDRRTNTVERETDVAIFITYWDYVIPMVSIATRPERSGNARKTILPRKIRVYTLNSKSVSSYIYVYIYKIRIYQLLDCIKLKDRYIKILN